MKVAPPFFFFFNDTPTTEIYTLSLPAALPILLLPPPLIFSSPVLWNTLPVVLLTLPDCQSIVPSVLSVQPSTPVSAPERITSPASEHRVTATLPPSVPAVQSKALLTDNPPVPP